MSIWKPVWSKLSRVRLGSDLDTQLESLAFKPRMPSQTGLARDFSVKIGAVSGRRLTHHIRASGRLDTAIASTRTEITEHPLGEGSPADRPVEQTFDHCFLAAL